jgi:hypothetical protein
METEACNKCGKNFLTTTPIELGYEATDLLTLLWQPGAEEYEPTAQIDRKVA